jgi:hypothetical protein
MKNLNLHFFTFILFVIITANFSAQSVSVPPSYGSVPDYKSETEDDLVLKNPKSNLQVSNIKIIESQSSNPGHLMDTIWKNVALGLGHNAVIVPQTTLDDTSFFSSTQILIVSSGVISLPANRINTIKSFVMTGKNVYLQCEYLASFETNQAFATLVNSLGGTFSWGSSLNGDISPMLVLGSLSNTPNNVPSISYYWYGVYGTGNNTIEYFMRYQGNNYGFIFTPVNSGYGTIVAQTDQDWIRVSTSTPLMQNILFRLGAIIGIQPISSEIPVQFSLSQNYPNPFNPTTNFEFSIPNAEFVNLTIYDAMGRVVEILHNGELKPGIYEADWNASNFTSGVYFYKLSAGSFTETKKMVLVK